MSNAEIFKDYVEDLQNNIEALSSMLESGATHIGKDANELTFLFRGELVLIMADIAAVDGKIDDNEVLLMKALNTIGNLSIDKDGLEQMVKEKKLPNPIILETVPTTFKIFCACDKVLKENGKKFGIVDEVMNMYTKLFAMMSIVDGEATQAETDAYDTFLKTLAAYYAQNN